MSKKWSLVLVALTIAPFSFAKESEQDTVVINIASKIRVDKELEDEFLKEAKTDGKMLTKKWASVRGVSEIETTVDRDDCGNVCKSEKVRSEGDSEEVTVSAEATKCACGKPATKSCSKCGKCSCTSCSSCCCK